jgi:hypothetical protein
LIAVFSIMKMGRRKAASHSRTFRNQTHHDAFMATYAVPQQRSPHHHEQQALDVQSPSPSRTTLVTGTGTSITTPSTSVTGTSTQNSFTSPSTSTNTIVRNIGTPSLSVRANAPFQKNAIDILYGASRPANTLLAYQPKQEEFKQYCEYKYSSSMYDPATIYLVDPDKVWDFMWYQSVRECKTRGGDSRRQQVNRFNSQEYESLICKYKDIDVFAANLHPVKGIGIAAFDSYRSALNSKWDEQKANRSNSYSWDDIWHQGCKNMRKYVKARVPDQKRRNYVEKLDSNFAPYTLLDSLPRIERATWDKGVSDHSRGFCSTLAALRNRYVFLQTFTGILRCESIMKAELSDLVYLTLKKDQDPHPMQFLILQIATGKYLF